MRKARILAPWKDDVNGRPAIYHCVSRVVDRRFVLKQAERDQFMKFMRLYEQFCGVRVLTHCLMSNHFHILLEVPPAPKQELGDEEFLARLEILYKRGEVMQVRGLLEQCRRDGHDAAASEIKAQYTYRMWDLSQFMKTLKQRFSCWFNKRHDRRGTLWEERFKSVLVEDGHTARVIAAYIDLNPVRAGIVKDPKDYRWCGYAAALAGDRASLEGICRVMGCSRRSALRGHGPKKPGELMEEYRVILFEDGKEVLGTAGSSGCDRIARRGMTRSEVKKVLKSGGKLGRSQMLLHRVDKFVNGAALGTREFVMEVAESIKESCGLKRTREGHALRESAMSLFSLGGIEDTMIP